jgi:hypothetical protein
MEVCDGVEPTTACLQNRCSTIELTDHFKRAKKRGAFAPQLLIDFCQLERSVFGLRILAHLEDALCFAILVGIRFRLKTDGQLHAHEGLDEVEELTRLGEVELRTVGNFHTRGDDELVEPPIDGILVEEVVLDLSVLAVLEGNRSLFEALLGEVLFNIVNDDNVFTFFSEAFGTVGGVEVNFELRHIYYLVWELVVEETVCTGVAFLSSTFSIFFTAIAVEKMA